MVVDAVYRDVPIRNYIRGGPIVLLKVCEMASVFSETSLVFKTVITSQNPEHMGEGLIRLMTISGRTPRTSIANGAIG